MKVRVTLFGVLRLDPQKPFFTSRACRWCDGTCSHRTMTIFSPNTRDNNPMATHKTANGTRTTQTAHIQTKHSHQRKKDGTATTQLTTKRTSQDNRATQAQANQPGDPGLQSRDFGRRFSIWKKHQGRLIHETQKVQRPAHKACESGCENGPGEIFLPFGSDGKSSEMISLSVQRNIRYTYPRRGRTCTHTPLPGGCCVTCLQAGQHAVSHGNSSARAVLLFMYFSSFANRFRPYKKKMGEPNIQHVTQTMHSRRGV